MDLCRLCGAFLKPRRAPSALHFISNFSYRIQESMSAQVPKDRETDITVYGATSFVAKHVLRYLVQVVETQNIKDIRITLGGRNPSKLQALKDEFCTSSAISDTFVASGSDLELLHRMAERTKVVINCAGPYSKYSNLVVQACADMGAHYVDFTGEGYWNAVMRQKHGSAAKQSGARIISMCGYDSIPSDISVWAAIEALRDAMGKDGQSLIIEEIKIWHEAFGVANGGTIHTALDYEWDPVSDFTIQDKQSRSLRKVPCFVGDPLMLTHPETVRHNPDFKDQRESFALGEWLNQLVTIDPNFYYGVSIPMPMAVINLKVVQASAVALNYGSKDLRIRERLLPLGFYWTQVASIFALIPMICLQWLVVLGLGILKIPKVGQFLCDHLAPPGSGAPDWLVNMGSCATYVEVTATNAYGDGTVNRGYAHIAFQGDPGNAVTAQCVSESALALLLDQESLPPKSMDGFGTPAELLGPALIKRFRNTTVRPIKLHTAAKIGVPKNDVKVYL